MSCRHRRPRLQVGVRALQRCLPNTGVCLWHALLLHDLITQTACLGVQYCILTLGVIHVFVCTHNHHRQHRNDPGNFEDCVQGRIRQMSALTPACAHAAQNVRPGRRAGDKLARNFGPIAPRNNHRYLPNIRAISVVGHAFRGWAIFTDGGTHTRGGETAGCGAIARSSLDVFAT